MWTNTVPNKIRQYMNNDTLAATAYANPINFIATYGIGTPERLAVARAQDEAQVSSGCEAPSPKSPKSAKLTAFSL